MGKNQQGSINEQDTKTYRCIEAIITLFAWSAVVVVALAVVIKQGLAGLLRSVIPPGAGVQILLSLVSIVFACFVASRGFLAVRAAIWFLRGIGTKDDGEKKGGETL